MKSQRLDTDEEVLIMFLGSDAGEGEEEGTDQDEDKGGDDGGAGGKPKDKSDDSNDGTISREEFDALKARMQAADRAKAAAEARIKEFEDKDKSELEKAARDRDEALALGEKLAEQLDQERIRNAFMSSNKFQWRNPSTAIKLADLSEVTIGDDGKVTGLDKALEALAKSDPYLLKGDDDEDDDKLKGKTAAGGTPPKGNKQKARREELLTKYPALRGRGA